MNFFFTSREKFNIFRSFVSNFIGFNHIKNDENIVVKCTNLFKSRLIALGIKDENSFEINLAKKAI
jgi:hypothetical protein